MQKSKSDFKCTVEVGAVPANRLIGNHKLNQLKDTFNKGMAPKTTKRSLSRLTAMASQKQKESYARGEVARAEAKARKEAKKAEAEKAKESK
jgi:hypothetical protein